MAIKDLHLSELWWKGPQWLARPEAEWPEVIPEVSSMQLPEETQSFTCNVAQVEDNFIKRFSSLTYLVRIVAWCLRFKGRRHYQAHQVQSISLTAAEINEAFLRCVRLSQRTDLDKEIRVLNQDGSLSKRNPLAKLGSFLDEAGTLRVGGRLQHSSLPYSERHPVILSKNCHLDPSLKSDWTMPDLSTLKRIRDGDPARRRGTWRSLSASAQKPSTWRPSVT